MPTDTVTEARKTIAEQQQRIEAHEQAERIKTELWHLNKELETLPDDGSVTIRVSSPASGKERLFALPREATENLLAFVKLEGARLEAADVV